MAISKYPTQASHYRGLSTDTKPTTDPTSGSFSTNRDNINLGAFFFETDTNRLYIYNGTSWVLINP